MKGDRVVMLRSDGFGRKGWLGVVQEEGPLRSSNTIRIRWDNGRTYLHETRNIQRLDSNETIEPNLAFLMRKEKPKS